MFQPTAFISKMMLNAEYLEHRSFLNVVTEFFRSVPSFLNPKRKEISFFFDIYTFSPTRHVVISE
uniref:Uncharacterized protein n=1 Tax=Anguilla anguilla TaxID=7936 RepID=A0A0E9WMB9_ANGAN